MDKKLNLIITGNFSYPKGMAGTKRIQHAIDVLKSDTSIFIHVIILRQPSSKNPISGVFENTTFETVAPNLLRFKFILFAPFFLMKARKAIYSAFDPKSKNILFVYNKFGVRPILLVLRIFPEIFLLLIQQFSPKTARSPTFPDNAY